MNERMDCIQVSLLLLHSEAKKHKGRVPNVNLTNEAYNAFIRCWKAYNKNRYVLFSYEI